MKNRAKCRLDAVHVERLRAVRERTCARATLLKLEFERYADCAWIEVARIAVAAQQCIFDHDAGDVVLVGEVLHIRLELQVAAGFRRAELQVGHAPCGDFVGRRIEFTGVVSILPEVIDARNQLPASAE